MRILLVLSSTGKDGANVIALDRAKHWTDWGHTVDLMIVTYDGQTSEIPDWFPKLNSVEFVPSVYPGFRLGTLRRLIAPVRMARRADIVVSGVEIGRCLEVGVLAAKIARRPFSIIIQNNIDAAFKKYVLPGRPRRFSAWAIRQADFLVCDSEALAKHTQNGGYSSAPIKAAVAGVDVEALRKNAVRPIEAKIPSKPYILGLGRLVDQKGFDLLIEAYANAIRMDDTIPDLVVAGDGVQFEDLCELVKHLGIGDRVHFTGYLDNPAPVIEKSDLFVLSSRFEGFGLVLVEAMAFGKPIISYDCDSGPREILKDGELGRLVPAEDMELLAEAIVEHYQKPDLLKNRAQFGMQSCQERFDPKNAAQQHLEYLQSIVG